MYWFVHTTYNNYNMVLTSIIIIDSSYVASSHPSPNTLLIFPVFCFLFFFPHLPWLPFLGTEVLLLPPFSLISSFFLFPKDWGGFRVKIGCSRVIIHVGFRLPTHNCLHSWEHCRAIRWLYTLRASEPNPSCHSSPDWGLAPQPWFKCCYWRFADLVTKLQGYSQSSLGHPNNHQSSPTSLIQNEHLSTLQISYRWLRTSPRKSAVPLFFPFEQISWHPDFIGRRICPFFFFFFFFPFFLFHLTGIGPTQDSIFDVVRNPFSVPFKTRCPLVLVYMCKCVCACVCYCRWCS